MRIFYIAFFALIVTISVSSCVKNTITPINNNNNSTQADTSTTLIGNTALVGNWNIVSDTISYNGSNTIYHGVATDHYIFSKYGNLYINEGLNHFIDTAVYAVNTLKYQVDWQTLYTSINGVASRVQSYSAPYTSTSLDTASMVLTADVQSASGPLYEKIVFKKVK